jgi:heme/copper-type cytochrome/quinol oxidase subunit 3
LSEQHSNPALLHHFDDMDQQFEASTLGMWAFLITEIMFFGGLFLGYTVYRSLYPHAFAEASKLLDDRLGAINTAVLICSSLTMVLAVRAAQLSQRRSLIVFLLLTMLLGSAFLGNKAFEYAHKFHEHLVPGPNFGPSHHLTEPQQAQLFFGFYFGMTGLLTVERRNQITDMLMALLRKDERELLEVMLEWTNEAVVDESRLASDVVEFVFNYSSVHLKDISMGNLLSELTVLMREHHMVLPSDLTLLFKALITLEGLGRQLDPEFDMGEHLEPFMTQVLALRYAPSALAKRAEHGIREVISIMTGLPRDLSRFFKELRKGRVRIDLDLKRLDHFGQQIDRSTNRLTIGIMTASLVIGSSIVMTIEGGPKVFGMPLLGFFGFVIAVFNSIWIVLSIWRSGKD